MSEAWAPVVGYEEWYEVSDHGRIRRVKAACGTHVGRILVPGYDGRGYHKVTLCNDGGQHTLTVHRIVTEAFLGIRPEGTEVNHKDGNKINNRLENLEYVTRSENALHAYRTGLSNAVSGEKVGSSKLTEENVHEIRRLLIDETQTAVALKFNVSNVTISDIARGVTWFHLKEEKEV